MAAEQTVRPDLQGESPKLDLDGFLQQVEQPLLVWHESYFQIQAIEAKYKGPGGIADAMTDRYVEVGMNSIRLRNLTSRYTNSQTHRQTAALRRLARDSVFAVFEDNTDFNLDDKTLSQFKRNISDTYRVSQDEFAESNKWREESLKMGRERRFELAQPRGVLAEQGGEIRQRLTDWIHADFDNLQKLAAQIQEKGDSSAVLLSLMQFMAEPSNKGFFDEEKQVLVRRELELRSRGRLVEFFDQIGAMHYGGKQDDIWPYISLSLPFSDQEIADLYQGGDASLRKGLLFANLVDGIIQNGKELPQRLKEKYFSYLSAICEQSDRTISRYVSQAKLSTFKERGFSVVVEPEIEQDARGSDVADQAVSNEAESTEGVKAGKIVLIDGRPCLTEDEIGEMLTNLARENAKGAKMADIDSYRMIISKMAGLRANAPNSRINKLTNFPVVSFSDGTRSSRVDRLRLNSNDAPRILLTYHHSGQVIVVLTVFVKEGDKSYDELRRRGFSDITLPPLETS